MNDRILLAALLTSGRLSEEEESAFRNMLEKLDSKLRNAGTLSARQRTWAQSIYDRLGLIDEEPCQNLYSQGIGKPDKPLPKYSWEMNKPLRPPGRV